jgi:serine/threonine protein kinase
VAPVTSVLAKEQSDACMNLDETAVHQFEDRSGVSPDQPMGSSDMVQSYSPPATPNPSQQGRYAFGSGARPLDGYTIKRAIGRGGFGEVYYATSDSGKEVALKLILRNLDVERRGVIQCMNLKCPNLLSIYDLKDGEGGDTFVIMEYVAGPSLAHVLKQHPGGLPPDEVRRWLKGLVDGVAYLHDHGIVHRDLKPANLFMEEGIVKIGDYGLAKLITAGAGSGNSESIGTCHYMAPEIGSGKYHKPIDIYAMGVILYEMLTGRVPFEGETVNEVLMKHLTSRPDVSMLPEPYKAIVAKALAKDPNHRPRSIVEMLPAEDAPKTPEVRIIGEGKPEPPASPWGFARWAQQFRDRAHAEEPPKAGPAKPNEPEDDVLRIGAEEPIFYIGPDTVPPRRQPTVQERLQANWRRLNRPIDFRGRRLQAARRPVPPEPQRFRQADDRNRRSPEPPPMPSTPSTRLRIAELTSSMLLAAPLTALLTIPGAAVLDIDMSSDPQRVAFLFGLSLMAVWVVLITNKWAEYRPADKVKGLWLPVSAASATAIGAFWLGLALILNSTQGIMKAAYRGHQAPGLFGLFFVSLAILFVVTQRWSGLTARDRPRRFRLKPVLYTALVGLLVCPLWPFRNPEVIATGVILSIVVQLVSPWNEEAAAYARYARAKWKRRGKTQAA